MNSTRVNSTGLLIIYNGVDYYPPTINAIDALSNRFAKVVVLEIDNYQYERCQFKSNVFIHRFPYKSTSPIRKLTNYLKYIIYVRRLILIEKPMLVIMYDVIAAVSIILGMLGLKHKPNLWYHSHDPIDINNFSKRSLGYYKWRLENKIIEKMDVFTLPAEERKAFFKINKFTGIYGLIPNYPSKERYSSISSKTLSSDTINLIYQGRISPGHGLEEIIKVLSNLINGKKLKLSLVGLIDEPYKELLKLRIKEAKAEDLVMFMGFQSYSRLPQITSKHHIGLAIYTGKDQMNSTVATASNKVYEYIACGLPFLYFDNTHFLSHYKDMEWAMPTDLSEESIIKRLEEIERDYNIISSLAKQEFLKCRNFENVFIPVLDKCVRTGETRMKAGASVKSKAESDSTI